MSCSVRDHDLSANDVSGFLQSVLATEFCTIYALLPSRSRLYDHSNLQNSL